MLHTRTPQAFSARRFSGVNESCPTWHDQVAHMNESWHTYEWVMAHLWMSHCTHMNESCPTWCDQVTSLIHEWVMSHISMSHVPHIWMSHVTSVSSCSRVDEVKSHTYEWSHVTHIWMSHVSSCSGVDQVKWHTYEWVMAHIWVMILWVTSRIYERVMSAAAVVSTKSSHTNVYQLYYVSKVAHINESCLVM